MQCAMVSPKSGALFEKELILQYVNEYHKDPISSDPLSIDELIEIRQSPYQAPRQPTLNSIPSLLSSLQNEWDSVALELFQLRKQLDDTRKELSTALYHHDAAVRVASRAIKERDEARAALQELTISISNGNPIQGQQVDQSQAQDQGETRGPIAPDPELLENVKQAVTEANSQLFAEHKATKHKVNTNLGTQLTSVKNFVDPAKAPLKEAVSISVVGSKPYITSKTGITYVYSAESNQYIKSEAVPKSKDINIIGEVEKDGQVVSIAGTTDKKFIDINGEKQAFDSVIEQFLTHPSIKDLYVIVDSNQGYSVYQDAKNVINSTLPSNSTAADIHPDGSLVGFGHAEGNITILDLKSFEIVKTLESTAGSVNNILFGNNGYWLYVNYQSQSSNIIRVWDLRKDSYSDIQTTNPTVKLLSDKSGHLIISLHSQGIEVFQYNKKAKDWVVKSNLELPISGDITNGWLIDDQQPEQLVVGVVSKTSAVEQFVLSE
ncbi:Pre-mRNA-processing factor 19 [Wickerhamomyces ciferrii]|uniref:Pre-mRNA-processing factor 19 n=1 Tax=Wickerhamomyces ciferrii (strain ATCC 14091 / BCRC 22168 / CBS 111 / JCM 3599 / NBRC 0793 / NRRL Y-1031 F-60-10) TaxID=1206466 RepID=K0KM98_WICCF|nr:Pre-mRNA-processing factor 19 [Wickerhamomyces ciferrii]CCH42238.1 Pre-mRNA-processing factor 19 [Wickerhamomyces ciferrii]